MAILKAETVLSDTNKLTLIGKKTIGHYKFDRLNIIYKNSILFMIIIACN